MESAYSSDLEVEVLPLSYVGVNRMQFFSNSIRKCGTSPRLLGNRQKERLGEEARGWDDTHVRQRTWGVALGISDDEERLSMTVHLYLEHNETRMK